MAAQIPDIPSAPTTTINQASIIITWPLPFNGASAITAYTVRIRESDGATFTEDVTHCNGATALIISQRTCTIPVSVLTSAPYSHDWGVEIYAIVSATNIIGESEYSVPGNGAVMLTVPDAPENLENVPSQTNGSQIGLTWIDGPISGGADVLDYTLNWDRADGTWEVYESGITTVPYVVTGLDYGLIYTFTVQARNSHGLSDESASVSILSAQTPNQPDPPTTQFVGTNIVIRWTAPVSGGSPITAYRIIIRESDGTTFTEDNVNCDGSDETIF